MKELITEITLPYSKEAVWKALTDFPNYCNWNSFLPSIHGPLQEKSFLQLKMVPPGQSPQNVTVEIIRLEPGVELSWLGHFKSIPGLIDGTHTFYLKSLSTHETQLIHREKFRGILVPFVWNYFLNRYLRQGFEDMNSALLKYLNELGQKKIGAAGEI